MGLVLTGAVQAHAQSQLNAFRHLTPADGLVGNSVLMLDRDLDGNMWVGTANGVSIFDGARVVNHRFSDQDSSSLPSARIDGMLVSKDGTVWVGTQDGLARYDKTERVFKRYYMGGSEPDVVHAMAETTTGDILMATWSDGVHLLDRSSDTVRGVIPDLRPATGFPNTRDIQVRDSGSFWLSLTSGLRILDMSSETLEMPSWPQTTLDWVNRSIIFRMKQHHGELWLATMAGVARVDLDSGALKVYDSNAPDGSFSVTRALFFDSRGTLWAGTHDGLLMLDPVTDEMVSFFYEEHREGSIAQGGVHSISEDNSGVLWIGSDEVGISLLDLYTRSITRYEGTTFPDANIPRGHIWSATNTADGTIWLAGEAGVGIWDDETSTYTPFDIPALRGEIILSVEVDQRDRLWFGTSSGTVCQLNRVTRACRQIPGLSSVFDLQAIGDREMWIASFGRLVRVNTDSFASQIYEYEEGNEFSLPNDFPTSILEDSQGRIWVTTERGFAKYDPLGDRFIRIHSNIPLLDSAESKDGTIWLIRDEIFRFNPETTHLDTLSLVTREQGGGFVKTGVADDTGRLWINMADRIMAIDSTGSVVTRFTGLGGRRNFQSSRAAGHRLPNGEILFGLEDGFYLFHPDSLALSPFPPVPDVSGVTFGGELQPLRHDRRYDINPSTRIVTALLSAPHFSDPDGPAFEIFLEGFDSQWRHMTAPEVTFTNLSAGTYTLQVRARVASGNSARMMEPVVFVVHPPWYFSTWFILLVVVSGAATIWGVFRWRVEDVSRQNERLETQVQVRTAQLESQTEQLKEANALKSRFFSNVSHELRTPLTLINGYLDDLLEGKASDEPRDRQRISRAKGLTERLDGMVTQLLELARADGNRLKMDASSQDIVPFVQRIVAHFSVGANRKFIDLSFEADASEMWVRFDAIRMDQIVSNLISNALKFTPKNGSIWVSLSQVKQEVILVVADSGPGIPEHAQEHVFERFYQVDNEMTRAHEGLGIGLALTHDLVQLHRGTISLDSREGEGTVFRVAFPVASRPVEVAAIESAADHEVMGDGYPRLPSLLLVEDNAELRQHIAEFLSDEYVINEAEDGAEAWRLLQSITPDIILSDVMMPGMTGLELLKEVRGHDRLKDLPVVLLTARTDPEAKIEGFEAKADDYITKPFNRRVLRARLANLTQRETEWVEAAKTEYPHLNAEQRAFIETVQEYVSAHVSTSELTISELAAVTSLGERTFQRRIKEITGGPAANYIRSLRLNHARALLEQGAVRSVTHAAQESGFGNVSYFSKLFEETFGINPKQYLG